MKKTRKLSERGLKSKIKCRVFQLVKRIPKGKITTYKEIGQKIGIKSYHVIGQILKENKDLEKIPCYKVVMSDGSIGGYSLGKLEKIKRLKLDGIKISRIKTRIPQIEKF